MMDRQTLEFSTLSEAASLSVSDPVRCIFASPRHGGPKLSEVRRVLASKGTLRFMMLGDRLSVLIDPGPPLPALVALDMIARSDAVGLERAVLSALPHVDEIVIGIDARSDDATVQVAQLYADTYYVFGPRDIGLSDAEWAADKIHFANARNLGRTKVVAPWTFVLDTDEVLAGNGDLREIVRRTSTAKLFKFRVDLSGSSQRDSQRLALTSARWYSPSHNQLDLSYAIEEVLVDDLIIVHDASMRTLDEQERRLRQRDGGIDLLRVDAVQGDLIALYHVAKHDLSEGRIDSALKLISDYRLRAVPHGALAIERTWLAFGVAAYYHTKEDYVQAETWAVRSLLDGPYVPSFCLLGDIAEEQGDLQRALAWFEAACAVPYVAHLRVTCADFRFGRREGLRRKLAGEDVPLVSEAEIPDYADRRDSAQSPTPAATPPSSIGTT